MLEYTAELQVRPPDILDEAISLSIANNARDTELLSDCVCLAFLVAFIPRGVRRAVESNNNNAKDWLPPSYAESADLKWFHRHFVGQQFALVSYDGCTYGKYEVDGEEVGGHERLDLLAKKLVPGGPQDSAVEADKAAVADSDLVDPRSRWFKRVITGPSVVEELVRESQLSEGEALSRLEGALVGPRLIDKSGNRLPQESRTTCLVVTLSKEATENNMNMRAAIESIAQIAQDDCAIPAGREDAGFFARVGLLFRRTFGNTPPAPDILHLGGPPVDNITIDIEGERTLMRLAGLSGIVGLALSFWCFRSFKLTSFVFAVGVISAGMSLAFVYYYGIFVEQLIRGFDKPRLGTVDAILMSMPAVVYVLGLSGAIHIVNYYKDARREGGLVGAAEEAIRHGRGPCTLAALTTAIGLGSLFLSDIVPIKKFGMFTALGVMATLAILFTLLPVALHRFPLSENEMEADARRSSKRNRFSIDGVLQRMGRFIVRHNMPVAITCLLVMGLFAAGLPRIETSVQLLKLFDEDAEILHDYAWLEQHLGNLVPMEIVVTVDPEQTRSGEPDDLAESNGKRYRMTMLERVQLVQRIENRIEALPQIGRALSVATFVPDDIRKAWGSEDYVANRQLEKSRERLLAGDYLREEADLQGNRTGRELWRLCARVRALDDGRGQEMDYGTFVSELREVVDPVVLAYRQRDAVLESLAKNDKRLSNSRLLVLFRAAKENENPLNDSQENLLLNILSQSGPEETKFNGRFIPRVRPFNLAWVGGTDTDEKMLAKMREVIKKFQYDAAVIVSAGNQDIGAQRLVNGILPLIDVSGIQDGASDETPVISWAVTKSAPQPLAAVYTGVVPLVYKTQRQLLYSLRESIGMATVLISFVMIFVLRSPAAGLVSMIPNIFPIVVVFGALGWLGIKVDIGIMMTASVALGVAVDDTIHFVWWFRHGIREGMDQRHATLYAYERCGTAMTQTTLIAGLGLAVFATSTFTPTQQFGYLMITILSAALVGDLILLPAMLSGPIGKFFCSRAANGKPKDQSDDSADPPAALSTVEAASSTPLSAASARRRDTSHRSARASIVETWRSLLGRRWRGG